MIKIPPIRLKQVSLRHGPLAVVSDLSGCFQPGSLTAVVGPNGAGKTTLLRALVGLHPLAEGSIDRCGLHASDFALLPQGTELDRSFPITCRDVVALAAPGLGPFRSVNKRHLAATLEALERVGLAEVAKRPVHALSAGQFQRLLFARTIVQDAAVILMDEPFSAVDTATANLLLTIVHEWHAQGRTQIVVLHDMELVRQHFPQTLMLTRGGIAWDATSSAADGWRSAERETLRPRSEVQRAA